MGYEDGELHVKYLGREYDVTRFRKFHPGGANTLAWFRGSDVTSQLVHTHHSEAAYSLLEDYRVGAQLQGDIDEEQIDWSQSLVKQVGGLGERYHSWVVKPVDRRARLFDADWLEQLTVVQWYVIPLVWVPVYITLLYISHLRLVNVIDSQVHVWVYLGCAVVIGFLIWPMIEYATHRWLFHLKPPDSIPLLIAIHFCLHGLHHKVPFDERRLLFPPVPAAALATLVYCVYSAILPPWAATSVGAGTLAGYIMYDLIHYYLHYGSPREGTYLYFMKRYHNQHHFVHHNHGFGISNHIWDKVFNTGLSLRKLKYTMKW
ncbi:fatty acid 2-hydroxylase [Homalodisca vitripennis]|nr:fatty acid 2-hydroxylase [Homalodisca vitripennis]XP_046679956.1 fatty acid 2-hydroxylase [Homalodisca vitripennis]XP_046679963.1 fatty acid 2-hydroxylase [Homalodisca vitripennis]XP_046679971.1 fatty acid 2-hydroxylase [Homalodisca vitripennis]